MSCAFAFWRPCLRSTSNILSGENDNILSDGSVGVLRAESGVDSIPLSSLPLTNQSSAALLRRKGTHSLLQISNIFGYDVAHFYWLKEFQRICWWVCNFSSYSPSLSLSIFSIYVVWIIWCRCHVQWPFWCWCRFLISLSLFRIALETLWFNYGFLVECCCYCCCCCFNSFFVIFQYSWNFLLIFYVLSYLDLFFVVVVYNFDIVLLFESYSLLWLSFILLTSFAMLICCFQFNVLF